MGSNHNNSNLQNAKAVKDDEFYLKYSKNTPTSLGGR